MAGSTQKARQEIELTGEQKYRAALKEIAANMKDVRAQQNLMNSEFDKGDQSTAKMTREYDLLGKKLKEQQSKLKLIASEIKRVSAEEGENSEHVRKLRNDYVYAQRDINNTERAMKQMGESIQQASTKSAQLAQRLKEAGAQLPAWVERNEKFGNSMTKAVTMPLAALGAASGKLFLGYEKKLYTVATIADQTQVSLSDLSEQMINASNASGMAAEDVADATYNAISAGVNTAEAAGFVEIAAKAAKGGLTDVTTAVDGATSAINAWGLGYENAESVFDKFITAQNLGKTTLGDLASQIGNLTGLAPQVGVSLDAVLAATAALTKNGVQTSTAMNGLKAVMSAVIKPTGEAAEEAKKLGLAFSAEALRDKGFTAFLQDVINKTGGSEESMAKLFGSVEGLSQIMLLAGSGADDYAEALEAMGKSAGATQRAFDLVTSSKIERMALSLNRVKNTGISVGAALSPGFELLADTLDGASQALSSLNDGQIKMIVGFGGALAAIGPVTTAVSKLTRAYNVLKPAMTAAKALFAGGGGMSLAIIGTVAGISALIAAVNKLSEKTLGIDKLQAAVEAIDLDEESIQTAAQTAMDALPALKVQAEALVDFELKGKSLYQEFSDNFGAGREHWLSSKERAQFIEDVQTWVSEAVTAGEASASAETQSLAAELRVAANAYKNYALQLAQSSKEPTEQEIAQLEALEARVISLGQSILSATNQTARSAELAYIKTRRGEGTLEEAALAVSHVQSQKYAAEYRQGELIKPRIHAAQESAVQASRAGDEAGYAAAMEELAELEAQNAEVQAQINAEYQQGVDEIIAGLALQHPEQMETIRQVSELQSAIVEATQLLNSDEEFEGDWAAVVDALSERLTGDAGKFDELPSMQQLTSALDAAQARMGEMLNETDVSGLLGAFWAQMQAGLLEGYDPAALSEDLSALLTMTDLKDDGKTIGQQWVLSEIEGVEGSQAEINAAIIEHCQGIIDSAMQGIEARSPSRKAAEVMGYWVQGETQGLSQGTAALRSAVQEHLKAFSGNESTMYTYGQRTMAAYVAGIRSQIGAFENALSAYGSSGVGSGTGAQGAPSLPAGKGTVNVAVNYTGGVAARDSQRLAQQLGAEIAIWA